MKNIIIAVFVALFIFSCKEKAANNVSKEEDNSIAKNELPTSDQDDWTILFDGTSFDQWKEYLKDSVSNQWKIEGDAMVLYSPKERKEGEGYNLVTRKDYTDFILSLDWKISEGGNSGIFWGVNEDSKLHEAYQTGPEIQILDNEKHPDAKAGTTHRAGALYDMVPPVKEVTNPVGEWNHCVVTINHKANSGSIELNGVEIVNFPLNNPEWEVMVSKSKFADWEEFGKYPTGKIGLQDHGNQVSFKNIKIKEL